MKTIFQIAEIVHNSFAVASLLHAAETLLRCVLMSLVCCGIVAAQERPASYFKRDVIAQAPLTFEAKRPKFKGDRPNSYFKRDTPPAGERSRDDTELVLPEFEEIDEIDQRVEVQIEDETFQPEPEIRRPAPPPEAEPRLPKPPVQARYQPTFASFLRQAVDIDDDLPEELAAEQPDDFQPLAVDFYSPEWCKFCPEVLARLKGDPRLTFNVRKQEFPLPRKDGEPWEYPLIVDPESNHYVKPEFMQSAGKVIEGINNGRAAKGLTTAAELPDIRVGVVLRDVVQPLLSSESGQWKFKNRAETFTHKAFTVSIPAGLTIRGSSDKRGSRVDFTGEKPTIKVNGFWNIRRNVNAVVASSEVVTLHLNWWQTVSWEVR